MGRILPVCLAVCVAVFLIWHPAAPTPLAAAGTPAPAPDRHPRPGPRAPQGDAVVYVAGAVVRPGLYRLHSGARADDAVRRAGGFLADADRGALNLAAHVADGDEVFAPVLGGPTPRAAGRRSRTPATKKTTAAVVNVNVATAAELATVPGIGVTLAARIVDVRERDGAYTSFDQLLDVAGMTPARLERVEPHLTI